MTTTPSAAGGGGHTPGEWFAQRVGSSTVYVEARIGGGMLQEVAACGPTAEGSDQQEANARLIAAAPSYFDAVEWIERAVTANAAPVNPFAALQEMTLTGAHITLDAGLVLDLLNAHFAAKGASQ